MYNEFIEYQQESNKMKIRPPKVVLPTPKSPEAYNLGHRIEATRAILGIPKDIFLNKIGVGLPAYRRYVCGRDVPGPSRIRTIAQHLGVTLDWLLATGPQKFCDTTVQ